VSRRFEHDIIDSSRGAEGFSRTCQERQSASSPNAPDVPLRLDGRSRKARALLDSSTKERARPEGRRSDGSILPEGR